MLPRYIKKRFADELAKILTTSRAFETVELLRRKRAVIACKSNLKANKSRFDKSDIAPKIQSGHFLMCGMNLK